MSKFYNAINWLQNGEVQLLFFIVGYEEDQNPTIDLKSSGIKSAKFYDYRNESLYPVVLLEVRAATEFENAEAIVREVFSTFQNRRETLICMFDGSYMSSEDLTDNVNIEHIYAVKTPEVELFGFSDDLRHSINWKNEIAKVQSQIIGHFGTSV